MAGGICLKVNTVLTVLGCVLYTVAFAGNNWVVGDDFKYGLWMKCNLTYEEKCLSAGLANRPGYFEAFRTLMTFALVAFYLGFITCFMDENKKDRGCRRTCYRYVHCFFSTVAVGLTAVALGLLGDHYSEDPLHAGMDLGWCFFLAATVSGVITIATLARLRYICLEHYDACDDPCCPCSCQKYQPKTRPGPASVSLTLSDPSLPRTPRSGRATGAADSLPPLPRGFGGRRGLNGNLSAGSEGRNPHGVSRLPIGSDSGMDISRDSTLDESATSGITGPQPLSVEILKRHDRRWQRRRGGSGRRRVEEVKHLRPSFSSTTSLSTTDSQSSAELAPRVHTPTNAKRVHYDIPKDPIYPIPPPPSYEEILGKGNDGESAVAPPIISFPIKMQGVELSRAITNAKTTATIDNVRMMAKAVKHWKSATRRLSKSSKGSLVPGSQDAKAVERLREMVAENSKEEESAERKRKKQKKKKEKEEVDAAGEPEQAEERIAAPRKQAMGEVQLGEKRVKHVEFSEVLVQGYSEHEEGAPRPKKTKKKKSKKNRPRKRAESE